VARVYIVVEGATEESFVNQVLAPVLWARQVYPTPLIIGSPGHKGGNVNYIRVKKDVLTQLKQDRSAYCSTMFDFYGLGEGFPGTPLPPNLQGSAKVTCIEEAVKADIVAEVPELRPDVRFIPFLQFHEYEGLLFSDPVAFAAGIRQPHLSLQFEQIRLRFATPEDINDDPNTAPSKRVLQAHPAYRKVLDGTLAAQSVGVIRMRQECPHFREWIERLEALGEV
jgi:uncharacterized protein DUF4276